MNSLNVDYMELLYEDPAISIVEMLVMHTGLNRNNCDISEEVILDALPTLANKPIWCIPSKGIFKNSDFEEHARNEVEEEKIRIFGIVPESSIEDACFVERDGKRYLCVKAILFKKYSPVPMDILMDRNGNCNISIEIKAKGDVENDILKVNEFYFEAVVALGKDIAEGIEGSEMQVVKFSLDDAISESNKILQTMAFAEKKKYSIPKGVKIAAQKGLDLRKEYNRGSTDVGINMARYLVNNEYATYEKVKKISEYFPRHEGDNLHEKDPPSNGWIAWLCWGSYEGEKWSNKIVNQVEKSQKNSLYYISKDEVGTEKALKLDTSKESLSFDEWGSVQKPEFKRACLKASNYKEVCKTAFLQLEEGWEEGKETALKYPVMQKKGDALVYNRYAISSAKAYAKTYNQNEVLLKVNKLYATLGLDDEKEKQEVENMEKEFMKKMMAFMEKLNMEDPMGKISNMENMDETMMMATKDMMMAIVDRYKDMEKEKEGIEMDMKSLMDRYANMEKEKMMVDEKMREMKLEMEAMQEEEKKYMEKLNLYVKQEEEMKMKEELQKFSHCIAKAEIPAMEEKIQSLTFAEFEKELTRKVLDYAVNTKTDSKVEGHKFSYSTADSVLVIPDEDAKKAINPMDKIVLESGVQFK